MRRYRQSQIPPSSTPCCWEYANPSVCQLLRNSGTKICALQNGLPDSAPQSNLLHPFSIVVFSPARAKTMGCRYALISKLVYIYFVAVFLYPEITLVYPGPVHQNMHFNPNQLPYKIQI
mmetsp:Transcript_153513/g.268436  ORF Transcript_153513/g.268436 Transcript_153513/m.268436 type:complete len:119 (+) Transcript_153513:229-585(+)